MQTRANKGLSFASADIRELRPPSLDLIIGHGL